MVRCHELRVVSSNGSIDEDAGVEDEDVDAAHLVPDPSRGSRHGRLVGDVHLQPEAPLDLGLPHITDRHLRAQAVKPEGDLAPDAAGATGDQSNPA